TEPGRLPAPRSFREEAGGSISPASLRARAFAKQIAALRRLRAPISFTVPCTALLRAHRHFVPSSPKERGEGTHPTARQHRRPPAETTTPDHTKDLHTTTGNSTMNSVRNREGNQADPPQQSRRTP